jgi:O-antigen/teichoic acid export membrane protein
MTSASYREKIWRERVNLTSIVSTSFISTIASVVLMLVFANVLPKETLGTYQYIIALVSFISAFSLTGVTNALIRAIGRKQYDFLPVAKKYLLFGSSFSSLIGIFVGAYYLYQGNILIGVAIPLSVFCMSLIYYTQRVNTILVATEEFTQSNYILKANVIAPLVFLLPIIFITQNAGILSVVYFLGSYIGILSTVYFFRLNETEAKLLQHSIKRELTLNDRIKYLKFTIHQSIITLINIGASHADKILIFQLLGAPQTALYYIATSLPERLRGTLKQFEPFLFSKFSKYSDQEGKLHILGKFLFALTALLPIFIIFYVLTPLFFSLFLPQYQESVVLTQIYGLTLFASAAIIPYSHLKAHSSNRLFYYYTFFSGTIRLLCIFVGIMQFDLTGAIIGATLSTLINTFVLLLLTLPYAKRQTANIQ